MVFWIIAAGMAGLSALILVQGVLRGRAAAEPAAAYDLRVYRDQLREVERDLARGVLAEADAERTRTEISRRILAADAQLSAETGSSGAPKARAGVIVVLAVAVVAGSLGLYVTLGQPGYGDMPRSLREAHADTARKTRPSQAEAEAQVPPATPPQEPTDDYLTLVQRLRDTVAARPDDLEGHMLLARNEAALGNFIAAYKAMEEVLRLKGDAITGQDYLNYADMMILAAGGYVSPEAEAVLKKALELEPRNGAALYYWGLIDAQTGRPDLAFGIWNQLLNAGPPDAPWIPPIRAQIEDIAALAGQNRFTLPPDGTLRGPSAEDVQAASDMTDEERQQMIRNMVDGLAERLSTEGGSVAEWVRLIRALGVLGDSDRAAAIYENAQEVFADDPAALEQLQAVAPGAGQ